MPCSLKLIPILLLLIAAPALAFAQDDEPGPTYQIKFSPAVLGDFANPGIQLSFEKRHSYRYASEFSVGWLHSFVRELSFDDLRGFRLAFEEKYFRLKKNPESRANTFLSCQLSYLNVKYTDYGEFIKDTALHTPAYFDTLKVARQTMSFNIKAGVQINVKRFVLEFSGGVGLKYKMVKRSELFDENAYEPPARHPNVFAIASQPGHYFTLSVPLNVSIGYRF